MTGSALYEFSCDPYGALTGITAGGAGGASTRLDTVLYGTGADTVTGGWRYQFAKDRKNFQN